MELLEQNASLLTTDLLLFDFHVMIVLNPSLAHRQTGINALLCIYSTFGMILVQYDS